MRNTTTLEMMRDDRDSVVIYFEGIADVEFRRIRRLPLNTSFDPSSFISIILAGQLYKHASQSVQRLFKLRTVAVPIWVLVKRVKVLGIHIRTLPHSNHLIFGDFICISSNAIQFKIQSFQKPNAIYVTEFELRSHRPLGLEQTTTTTSLMFLPRRRALRLSRSEQS